mmetsp:Transcript_11457/g.27008  ORF Transcript_11457/g.27008 Transcript_11457/m.27008 type:complete len:356 (+) Transcript_11457:177-1244(+)
MRASKILENLFYWIRRRFEFFLFFRESIHSFRDCFLERIRKSSGTCSPSSATHCFLAFRFDCCRYPLQISFQFTFGHIWGLLDLFTKQCPTHFQRLFRLLFCRVGGPKIQLRSQKREPHCPCCGLILSFHYCHMAIWQRHALLSQNDDILVLLAIGVVLAIGRTIVVGTIVRRTILALGVLGTIATTAGQLRNRRFRGRTLMAFHGFSSAKFIAASRWRSLSDTLTGEVQGRNLAHQLLISSKQLHEDRVAISDVGGGRGWERAPLGVEWGHPRPLAVLLSIGPWRSRDQPTLGSLLDGHPLGIVGKALKHRVVAEIFVREQTTTKVQDFLERFFHVCRSATNIATTTDIAKGWS